MAIKISKNVFKKAKSEMKDGFQEDVELDPGRYMAVVQDAKLVDQSDKGEIACVFHLKIVGDSEFAGGRCSVWQNDVGGEGLKFLLYTLRTLGYEDNFDDLDQKVLEEILEDISVSSPVVRVTAKRSGEYINLRIDKVFEDMSAGDVSSDGSKKKTTTNTSSDGEEEEPFDGEEGEEEEEEEEEDDDLASKLDGMDRSELKLFIKEHKLKVRVMRKMSDDDIRDRILSEMQSDDEEEEEEEEEGSESDNDEAELKKGMTCGITFRGKDIDDCKVTKVDEKSGKVTVKKPDGKTQTVVADKVYVYED